jgi:hypothetical protein
VFSARCLAQLFSFQHAGRSKLSMLICRAAGGQQPFSSSTASFAKDGSAQQAAQKAAGATPFFAFITAACNERVISFIWQLFK